MIRNFSRRILAADGARTNEVLIQGASNIKIMIHQVDVIADGDNSVKPNVQIGFTGLSVGLSVGNVSVGPEGVVADIMGMAAGAIYNSDLAGSPNGPLMVSNFSESLKYTCEAPTGGGITINVRAESIQK